MADSPNAFLYIRVSTEEQAERGYSLDAQAEDCLAKAMELGCGRDRITVYRDEASGAYLDRPGLSALRERVAAERPQYVIVYDPDRLARKLSHQLLLTDELLRYGVTLEFVNFEWKNTAEGRLFYQLRGMFAEFEREKIRERTMRGRYTKTKDFGKLSGDPRLYGYRFDTENDVLLPDPVCADTVRLLFALAADGWSGERISREMQSRNIPAPRGNAWYGATVTRILRNESYLGTFMAYKVDYHQGFKRNRPKDEQIPLPIEPLVDRDLFARAQRTLDRNRTRSGRPPARAYLLAGLGICACGKAMRAGTAAGNKRYGYYSCPDREGCGSRYWNSDTVDEAVWLAIRSYAEELAAESGFRSEEAAWDGNEGLLALEAEWLREQIRLAESRRSRLMDLFVDGRIARDAFDRKTDSVERELEALRSKDVQMKADRMLSCRNGVGDRSEEQVAVIVERLRAMDAGERKELSQLLIKEVRFGPDRGLSIRWNVQDDARKSNDSQSDGRP